ncbi:MAG: IS1634 family transposase [Clostridiales bacterium]|jgi:transposase|nr:IS1634 family transposase [Clostridiales bacterium]
MAYLRKNVSKGIEYWSLCENKRVDGKVVRITLEYFGSARHMAEMLSARKLSSPVLDKMGWTDGVTVISRIHGSVAALVAVAKKIGITEIFDFCLPKRERAGVGRGTALLAAAIQRACQPGSKNVFASWVRKTTLPSLLGLPTDGKTLTSQVFWEMMDGLTESDLAAAEDAVTGKLLALYNPERTRLALDYTNYYSYISSSNIKCSIARRGHNKQKRNDLRQYSLAIVSTHNPAFPLFSMLYEGNLNDVIAFGGYYQMLQGRLGQGFDKSTLTLVFDGGSVNKTNLAMLDMHFISSFPLSSAKELYDIDIGEYNHVTIGGGREVLCYRIEKKTIWGRVLSCVLTYSQELYDGQMLDLERKIEKKREFACEIQLRVDNPKARLDKTAEGVRKAMALDKMLTTLISVGLDDKGKVLFDVDEDAKEIYARKIFGKKLIVTDQLGWTTEAIISAYREQGDIEGIFRDSKDVSHFSVRPQYHYTDEKVRVHVFCCLVGLILATALNQEMKLAGIHANNRSVLDTLEDVRMAWVMPQGQGGEIQVIETMEDAAAKMWEAVQQIH